MNLIEDIIIKWKVLICSIFSIAVSILYSNGKIENVKGNLNNIGMLLSSFLVVVTFILTLLLYLNEKERYQQAIAKFGMKKNKNMIFSYVYKIIFSNICCLMIVISIGIINIQISFIKSLISLLASFFFCYQFIGTMYMLWFAIDIAGNINVRNNGPIE